MKDNIVFGSIAGAIGGAVGLIYSYILFRLGISPMASLHLAASLVVTDVLHLTIGGIIWAIVTHLIIAATFGVLFNYLLIFSGKDYWAFKAVGVGALLCLIAHSYLIPLMRTDQQLRSLIFNAPSFGTMISTHALISLITCFIIVKYKYTERT